MIKYNFTVSIFFDDRCELIGYSKWNLRGTSVDFSIVKCMYLSQKIKQKKTTKTDGEVKQGANS